MYKEAFTRNRTLTFSTLILHCLNLTKGSNQQELDNTFKIINDEKNASQYVSKAAFTKARKKLSHAAFIDLNRQVVSDFYLQNTIKKWRGFRLCAIDGSQFRLPNESNIINEFGLHKSQANQKPCSMGLSSMYYDVLNEMVIDASLNPLRTSERELAYQHLAHADENDLVLLDRGYPAFWLYVALQAKGMHFCMRAKDKLEKIFRQFKQDGDSDRIVEIIPSKAAIKICVEKGLPTKPIKLRLIRVSLENETEILITNLLDEEKYPASIFKNLYHLRWGIEEGYKRQKHWLEIENFSGKSSLSVKQDYYAKLVTLNLTAILVHESQKYVDKKYKTRRLNYKVNFAQALSKMKDTVIHLLLNVDLKNKINNLLNYIANTVEAVRRNRKFTRNTSKVYKNINHLCYKRCR